MLIFIAGLIVGSSSMLFVMSLAAAAKRGDQMLNEQAQIEFK
ncbi:hypothetical protein [Neobacillus cucumis]|nr:hypothetical protein [Neobacillus cucumis]